MYYTEAMHDPLTHDEFIGAWKLRFGYEWVDWLTAIAFKEDMIGRHSFQLSNLARDGVFERMEKEDSGADASYIRLLK